MEVSEPRALVIDDGHNLSCHDEGLYCNFFDTIGGTLCRIRALHEKGESNDRSNLEVNKEIPILESEVITLFNNVFPAQQVTRSVAANFLTLKFLNLEEFKSLSSFQETGNEVFPCKYLLI